MTDYRRNFLAGSSFFFTVNPAELHLQLLGPISRIGRRCLE
jgi:hypothetical protein